MIQLDDLKTFKDILTSLYKKKHSYGLDLLTIKYLFENKTKKYNKLFDLLLKLILNLNDDNLYTQNNYLITNTFTISEIEDIVYLNKIEDFEISKPALSKLKNIILLGNEHGYKCQCCGSVVHEVSNCLFYQEHQAHFLLKFICDNGNELTIDHITPKSKGGSNSIDNYQLLCESCNLLKANEKRNFSPYRLKSGTENRIIYIDRLREKRKHEKAQDFVLSKMLNLY